MTQLVCSATVAICSGMGATNFISRAPTVASEILEGMFLVNNSPNTQCRAPKPSAILLLRRIQGFLLTLNIRTHDVKDPERQCIM